MNSTLESAQSRPLELNGAVNDLTNGFHRELNQPPPPPKDGHIHLNFSGLGTELLLDTDSAVNGALFGGILMGVLDKQYYFRGLAVGALAGVAGYEFLSRVVLNRAKPVDATNIAVNPGHAIGGALDSQHHVDPGDSKNPFTIVDNGKDLIHRPSTASK